MIAAAHNKNTDSEQHTDIQINNKDITLELQVYVIDINANFLFLVDNDISGETCYCM